MSHTSIMFLPSQFSSVAQSCPTLCDPMYFSTPGFPVHHQLPELTQTHVHWVDDAIQSSHPLLLPSRPAPNISQHQGLSNESALCLGWPEYWSFSFSISHYSEYSGLISFRTDWLDLLAVQGTFKSLLQHHNSKASILWCSAFFMVQLWHPYTTTEKTTALTILLAQRCLCSHQSCVQGPVKTLLSRARNSERKLLSLNSECQLGGTGLQSGWWTGSTSEWAGAPTVRI